MMIGTWVITVKKGVHRNNKLEHDKDVDLNHLTLAGG